MLGLPILKLNVVYNAIVSLSIIGWVGSYDIPIFARLVMAEEHFKPGPFYLGKASKPICLVAFVCICYTCSTFVLPTTYPAMDNFQLHINSPRCSVDTDNELVVLGC